MATGGAWQSEYFDKRPGMETAAHGPPVAHQTPPPMYTVDVKPSAGRKCIVVGVVLRVLTFIFALTALAILVFAKSNFGLGFEGTTAVKVVTVKFTVMRAFKFLFAACCIVAVHSLFMTVLNLVSLCVKGLANNKIVALITFVLDQMFAYFLISAGAAGANAVMVSNDDENISGYKPSLSCNDLGISGFCTKASASVGLAFAAFLFLAITCILSARQLFKRV